VTLFIKDLVSIGAVPAGDNPTADIVIWKKAPASKSLPGSMDERLDAIRNAWREAHPYIPNGPDSWVEAIYSTYLIVSENEKKFRVPYSESEGSFQFGAMTPVELRVTIVDKSRDTAPKTKGNINVEGFTLDDLPDEYRAGVESLIAAAATPEPLDEAEIEKAAETQALIAKLQDENAETRKALADEIAKRRHAELVAKAQADGLSEILPVGELADAFAELDAAAPESFAAVYEAIKEAAPAVAAAQKALGRELGENKGEQDPAELAKAYVAKQQAEGDKRSAAQIRAEFWRANPELKNKSREGK